MTNAIKDSTFPSRSDRISFEYGEAIREDGTIDNIFSCGVVNTMTIAHDEGDVTIYDPETGRHTSPGTRIDFAPVQVHISPDMGKHAAISALQVLMRYIERDYDRLQDDAQALPQPRTHGPDEIDLAVWESREANLAGTYGEQRTFNPQCCELSKPDSAPQRALLALRMAGLTRDSTSRQIIREMKRHLGCGRSTAYTRISEWFGCTTFLKEQLGSNDYEVHQ